MNHTCHNRQSQETTFFHKQELHFKAIPERPDAVYARKLQEVLGGQYGEITVALAMEKVAGVVQDKLKRE